MTDKSLLTYIILKLKLIQGKCITFVKYYCVLLEQFSVRS